MRRVIIVQARMTSTRLPGKVLMDLAGRPMLAQQLRRLKRCASVDEIVVATTVLPSDDAVADLAGRESVRWFRGDEQDVLSRYAGAAREAHADVVIRVTADCPLISPEVVDRVIDELLAHRDACDYASNTLERTYPRGLDTEALFADVLDRANRLATSAAAREHVTPLIYAERPDLFLLRSITDTEHNEDLRWTVDFDADLQMIRALYEQLDLERADLSHHQIAAWLRDHPDVMQINAHAGR